MITFKILLVHTFPNYMCRCLIPEMFIISFRFQFYRIKPKLSEIWTQLFISPVILNALIRQTTFWNYRGILRFLTRLTKNATDFFQRSNTTFNSSVYCHVSWDNLFVQNTNHLTFGLSYSKIFRSSLQSHP